MRFPRRRVLRARAHSDFTRISARNNAQIRSGKCVSVLAERERRKEEQGKGKGRVSNISTIAASRLPAFPLAASLRVSRIPA